MGYPRTDPARFWVRFAALALLLAPALVLVANLMGLNQVGTDASTLIWVRAHETRYLLGVAVLLAGFGLFLPAGARLATALTGRGAALGRVGGLLFLVGLVATLATTSAYLLSARLTTLPGIDPNAALVIKRTGDEDGGIGLFLLVGVLLFLGAILLVIGLLRARRIPGWAGILSIVGILGTLVADVSGAPTAMLAAALLVWWAGFAGVAHASLAWPPAQAGGPDHTGPPRRRTAHRIP